MESPHTDQEIDEAIRRIPNFDRQDSGAWLELAWKMIETKRSDLAIECFHETVRHNRETVEAWANLGTLYRNAGHLESSIECFREAIELQPNNVGFIKAIASALRQAGNRCEAKTWCETGLGLEPESSELLLLLGNVHQELDEFDAAIEHLEQAIHRAGRTDQHLSCLGIAWYRKGDIERAITLFRESVDVNPAFADGHFHLGMALLLTGQYEQGWDEYEWRLGGRRRPLHHSAIPVWDGRPLTANQTLLLAVEQGFGDTIQFIRFAKDVKRRYGCQIVVQAQRRLIPLLATCHGIDTLIARDDPLPSIDAYIPLASLPSILHFDPDQARPQAPYLFADPKRFNEWKAQIRSASDAQSAVRRIGLSWQGDPKFPVDHCRSIPLIYFLPLLDIPNTQWISLQRGHGTEQLNAIDGTRTMVDFGNQLDADDRAFLDTAAIMKRLDLVITSDTAIAHLAGALGVPVWIGLSCVPDWRWNLGRSDSVWYPTAKLFRQSKPGYWPSVISKMQEQLQKQE